MLYVFVGNDVVGVRNRVHAFFESKGVAPSEVERVAYESYQAGMFPSLVEDQSLFGDTSPVLLDFLCEDEEIAGEVEKFLEAFASSERIFVLMDQKPLVAREKLLKAHAKEYVAIQAKEKEAHFNTFALADALLKRDKKSLWVLLARAKQAGVEGEAIIGILFWQLKMLRLAESTKNAEEAGVKEFPYTKAKSALKLFPKKDLIHLSEKLLTVYHDGHFGADIDVGLERWVLNI